MKLKKAMLAFVCALALVVGSVMGTMAYLTSTTGTVTNTFTVGKVEITMDEAPVNEYGVEEEGDRVQGNEYKLIPGHTYVKDPTVYVDSESEEAYLFVKIVNGIEEIEAAGNTTIANQMAGNWTLVDEENGIYRYNSTVVAGNEIEVFGTFTLAENADVTDYANATITIKACAVQADGMTAALALTEATAKLNA